MIHKRLLTTLVCAAAIHGCGQSSHVTSSPQATPAARFALGKADPYPGQQLSEGERITMARSFLARRARAWDTLQKVTAPVRPARSERMVERWTTWYGRDDYERMFAHGFTRLSPAERRVRAPITETIASISEDYLAQQIAQDPAWSAERRAAFLSSLRTTEDWTGLAGIGRVLFSPGALAHTMTSYQQVISCDARPPMTCIQPFSSDAVVLKTAWVRSELGFGIPAFDTDERALALRLAAGGRSWDHEDRMIPSIAGRALEQRTQAGGTFQLAGMHIMSKESADWLWITLWWSDDPDTDFGEDRPESLRSTPWANYKMCVVTEFSESGGDIDAVSAHYPSLASAIGASLDDDGMSWCSNPYIEKGADNQRTNCIGCHQYAGASGIAPEQILQLPTHGRDKRRNDFPADYLWTLTFGPESIRQRMQEQVRYYSSMDP